jgi:18S rRNA (guanine1575-N7)-methyltransferase|eukprot:TRINITY_DN2141_c0_g1_i1.p1 TRINITY_DN2141_c0_g1~~TRINITY_DN2141_c0_g1_i1.p1  ORF type:complete len:288 (-),score=107.92 TRINITY_DN2141_c0_g1_i1:8-871(-)
MSRPEHTAPPQEFYSVAEAAKYATSSRMAAVQEQMAQRALQLLSLPAGGGPALILDIGCGTGMAGEVLAAAGHEWIGMDISRAMLEIAAGDDDCEGDVIEMDMGMGVPFRPGSFDAVVSISALQWLCNADTSTANPRKRLQRFFSTLYGAVRRGAKAVFQFFPENPLQMELITNAATRSGFTGGVVVDYPNSSKAKKYFLCLSAGPAHTHAQPRALGTDDARSEAGASTVFNAGRDAGKKRKPMRKTDRVSVKSRDWIQAKKDRQRKQGKDVKSDSKYTGRKRGPHF